MKGALKKIQRRQITMTKGLEGRTKGAAEVSPVEMRQAGNRVVSGPGWICAEAWIRAFHPSVPSAPGQGSALYRCSGNCISTLVM